MMGRRIEHERAAAQACFRRRVEQGEPPAAYVLDAWRQRVRIAREARQAQERKRGYWAGATDHPYISGER